LPHHFGIGSPDQMDNAQQMFVDFLYLQRGLAESSLADPTKSKLMTNVIAAEARVHDLAVLKDKTPADGEKIDKQAVALRADFDRQADGMLAPAQITDWRNHSLIVFFEEMLLSNGPDAFLQETAPGVGLNLTDQQKTSIQPALTDLGKKLEQAMAPDRPQQKTRADGEALDAAVDATREKIRKVLTADELKKWDQGILDSVQPPGGEPQAKP